ncbi:MAG: AMP-binding protein, partial [Rhizobiales bacterium]|nr:AMP-binding protein [Hyphomicrobiales bacterium]
DDHAPNCTGQPVTGYELKIIYNDGIDVPVGETGRLAVKGPTGCRYLNDPRQVDYVENGWNITGDAFFKDEDGYYHFVSRNDDMIISSGYNIAGPEVEDALLKHKFVKECAVVAKADDFRGSIVQAHIVLQDGVVASDEIIKTLQDHVKQTIAPFKYPRAVEFCASLPKTQTGKIQRYLLKK